MKLNGSNLWRSLLMRTLPVSLGFSGSTCLMLKRRRKNRENSNSWLKASASVRVRLWGKSNQGMKAPSVQGMCVFKRVSGTDATSFSDLLVCKI